MDNVYEAIYQQVLQSGVVKVDDIYAHLVVNTEVEAIGYDEYDLSEEQVEEAQAYARRKFGFG